MAWGNCGVETTTSAASDCTWTVDRGLAVLATSHAPGKGQHVSPMTGEEDLATCGSALMALFHIPQPRLSIWKSENITCGIIGCVLEFGVEEPLIS
ncbi:hypothetical protein TREES_T100006431 [Tupaia chinensis]|uniref:Uncharacterized protein n=1 Tax=Tupaia chinensis TaxID=246437 RepID=L9L131_TUPCH|nr:hypothetical protein TREES_T100006431 [Tupaia chinensis]